MSQTKITYTDKTNNVAIVDREKQVTAEDLNEIKEVVNAICDALDGLTYMNAEASLSLSKTLFELGLTSLTSLDISWAVTPNSDEVLSVNITNLTSPFENAGSQSKSIDASTTFTLTVTREKEDGTSRPNLVVSKTITATTPKFWGVSSSNTYPETDPYSDLNKLIQTSSSIGLNYFTANNQYGWFVSTKSGAIVTDQNGFPQTTWVEEPITLVLPDGETVQAYKYVSPDLLNVTDFGLKLV